MPMFHSKFVGSALFRVATAVRGESAMFALIDRHCTLERSSEASIHAVISSKLSLILGYAGAHVEKYRALLPVNVDPADAYSVLNSLPETTKEELRSGSGMLRASNPKLKIHSKTTGGSTGQPVTVWKDSGSVAHERAASWAFYQSYGIRIGDRSVRFWGSPTTLQRRIRSGMADLAMNRQTFSAFAFAEENLEAYWRVCSSQRPQFYYGYASMLAVFAEYLIATNRSTDKLAAKAAVSTSEVLGPAQRRAISTALQCIVRNEYGCGEVGPIAYECEAGRLHVAADNVLVEVLSADGSPAKVGDSGRVLVTDLNNRAMPLLRYATGDFAEVGGACTCGRNTFTLAKIWGREYDFISAPDGRRYHGEYFLYLFEDLARAGVSVEQFQVVQRRNGDIVIRVRSSAQNTNELLDSVLLEARRRLPNSSIQAELVAAIPPQASGKSALIIREA
jgi:phenylacetate-CoA ligase